MIQRARRPCFAAALAMALLLAVSAATANPATVKNNDTTPEEFESTELRREKVVAGGEQIDCVHRPVEAREVRVFWRFESKDRARSYYCEIGGTVAMLGAAIIVFREVLEAALIVGIVLAASTGTAPRVLDLHRTGRRRRRRRARGSVRRRDRCGRRRHRLASGRHRRCRHREHAARALPDRRVRPADDRGRRHACRGSTPCCKLRAVG